MDDKSSLSHLVRSLQQALALAIRQRNCALDRNLMLQEQLGAARRGQPVNAELAELRATVTELQEQLRESEAIALRNAQGWMGARATSDRLRGLQGRLPTVEQGPDEDGERGVIPMQRIAGDTVRSGA